MASPWSELLANFAIVIMFVSAWSHMGMWQFRRSAKVSRPLFGLWMGTGSVVLMLVPAELVPGVFIDLRTTPLVIAGIFGGPLAAAISGGMALAFRIYEGGIGVFAGCASIVFGSATGGLAYWFLGGRNPSNRQIPVISLVASAATIVASMLLPSTVRAQVFTAITLPSSVLLFGSILLASLALRAERSRIDALESRRVYKAIVEALPDCLNMKDLDGRFVAANSATARLMNAASANELIGKSDADFYPAEIAQRFHNDEAAIMRSGKASTIEQLIDRADGTRTWLSTLKAPFLGRDGQIVGLITHNRDISERKELELELAASQLRLKAAITQMADGLVMFDANKDLVLCNDQYGLLITEAEASQAEVAKSLHTPGEARVQLSSGNWIEIRTTSTDDGGSLSVVSDITAAKAAEQSLVDTNQTLRRLADYDGLTGLMTRRAFDESLYREMGRCQRSGHPLSLLLIDVDRFKNYNDRYGHIAGDRCLQKVAQTIQRSAKKENGSAYRYGGEEIAVLLPEIDIPNALKIAEAICMNIRYLGLPHEDSEKGVVTVSIGVDTANAKTSKADLINGADKALYAAKADGRDRACSWAPRFFATSRRRSAT